MSCLASQDSLPAFVNSTGIHVEVPDVRRVISVPYTMEDFYRKPDGQEEIMQCLALLQFVLHQGKMYNHAQQHIFFNFLPLIRTSVTKLYY